MAADPSYFSKGVVAALSMVSGGTCYWPDPRCLVPVTADINGDMVLNVEIAHIRGAHENGPRYVPDMTDTERRMFGNLLLMCPSHHRVIDVLHEDDYTIETLERWKRSRESASYDTLRLLPTLDEDVLQASITKALRQQAAELKEQVDRFESALSLLAEIDAEAAGLLAERMRASEKFLEAARKLEHTQYTAVLLQAASERLAHTEDTADILLGVARSMDGLSGLEDAAELLLRTTNALEGAISGADEACEALSAASQDIGRRIEELRGLEGMF